MSIASPYYWLGVAALAAVLAVAITAVGNERSDLRVYRVALAFYVAAWVAAGTVTAAPLFFGSLNVMPHWPPLWTGLPVGLTVGVLAVLVGGYLVAWLVGARRALLHPRRLWTARRSRPRPPVEVSLTEAELRAAEAYDAKWQIEDRRRNRRLGTGPRL
jgi:hypothetical protein